MATIVETPTPSHPTHNSDFATARQAEAFTAAIRPGDRETRDSRFVRQAQSDHAAEEPRHVRRRSRSRPGYGLLNTRPLYGRCRPGL